MEENKNEYEKNKNYSQYRRESNWDSIKKLKNQNQNLNLVGIKQQNNTNFDYIENNPSFFMENVVTMNNQMNKNVMNTSRKDLINNVNNENYPNNTNNSNNLNNHNNVNYIPANIEISQNNKNFLKSLNRGTVDTTPTLATYKETSTSDTKDTSTLNELYQQLENLKILYEKKVNDIENLYQDLQNKHKTINDLTNYISKKLELNSIPIESITSSTTNQSINYQPLNESDLDYVKVPTYEDDIEVIANNESELDKKIFEKEKEISFLNQVTIINNFSTGNSEYKTQP